MTSPAQSSVQNLLPVQAYFDAQDNFVTFIGQNKPFYATPDPNQSGLNITNSTINSTTIGATTPSTGHFTSGQVDATPTGATDIANKQYVDYLAAGLSWKAPVTAATTVAGGNITLSGAQTIDTVSVVAGDTVLVKNQTAASQNGIYTVASGAWARSVGADTWNEYIGAIIFVVEGSQAGSAWYCTAQPGGTLGTTAINWSNFSVASSYTAGTGLTLAGTQFSITNTAVTPSSYGSATQVGTFTVNQQGQLTLAGNTTVTPAITSVTGLGTGIATWLATPSSANLAAAVSDETGSGALVFATSPTLVTPILGTPQSGNFSTGTFTWPTFNQNTTGTAAGLSTTLAITSGGTGQTSASAAFNALSPITTAGDLILGNGTNSATRLGIGSNGYVLTSNGTTASWAAIPASGVTSFSAGTTGFTPSTGTTGAITLAGTLNVANGGTGLTTLTANYIPYGNGTSAFSSSSTFTYDGTSLTLGAASARLIGDFSNATVASRLSFITSTTNGSTGIYALPNGTSTAASWQATNNATATNCSKILIATNGSTDVQLVSGINGTGTYLPLAFWTNGAQQFQITTAGGWVLGTGTSNYGTSGQVLTSSGNGVPTWSTNIGGNAATATTATNATNIAITDNTSSVSTYYPVMSVATTGNNAATTSSTKLSFVPSTGVLSATTFSGAGTSLTGTASSLTAGTATTANALNTSNNYQVNSLGVGTAGSGTAGEIRATNNVTAYYSSDIKFKSNVQNIENALDKVTHIGGKTFDWSDDYIKDHGGEDGYFVQKSDFGVIAQDVQEVFPQAVRTRDDGTLAVDYAKLSALAFAAIAELKARIEQLESK